jgi:hypothetical protein
MSSQGVAPISQALPSIVDIDTKYLRMTAKEFREHTVKDFLSRPVVVSAASSVWSTTQAQATQLATYNFPDSLITNTMYQEKLRGFVGLRGTLNVRVQVNSQPFQAGRLMLQYIPYAQYMTDRVTIINSTLQGRSGCPRVDLDLSVGTEVTMEIPYVSPHAFYNLITAQGSFGSVYLVVYSPLQDQTGAASVEYTVWAWLTNVEVEYPTGAPINTTFGPRAPEIERADVQMELKQLSDNKSPSAGVGKIASGLQDLSRIPIVGNVFTKPAWITSQASNILKLLGYSKPTSQGMICESKLRTQVRMANYNGVDASHKLALSCDNEIETQPGLAGTSVDEMAISRIVAIPNYWATFSWPTTVTTGTIYQDYITPTKIKPLSATITNRFVTTHMGYVANTFGLWHGSLIYTFKFVKTQFHSGRLMISFFPFSFNTDLTTTNGDVNKCYRVIVDLRDSTEVSLAIPYVSSRPWMNTTRPGSSILGTTNQLLYNAATGVIQVDVLNQLKATSTVVGNINVLVEVAGGPDLKFSNPTCPNFIPYSGVLTLSDDFDVVEKADVQMFMGTDESIQRNEAQMGRFPDSIDAQSIESNWAPEALCSGEKVLSVRQLIKRFGFTQFTTQNTASVLAISPFTVQPPQSNTTGFQTVSQYEYWYSIYAFWRGSMRWKMLNMRADTATGTRSFNTAPVEISQYASLSDSMATLINSVTTSLTPVTPITLPNDVGASEPSTTVVLPSLEGMIEFEVPYYNVSHITPAVYAPAPSAVTSNGFFLGNTPPQIVTVSPFSIPSATNVSYTTHYRAPGDDFSFFYLLGVPPLVNYVR